MWQGDYLADDEFFLLKNTETLFISWDLYVKRRMVASMISRGETWTPAKLSNGMSSLSGVLEKKFDMKSGMLRDQQD
jgi:hypothetical protein